VAKTLPYRVDTATGATYDIDFPLHAETVSPMRVNQLLSAVLDRLDREIKVLGETANGDVLQALAMALAVRSGMIHAPKTLTDRLTQDLVATALGAVSKPKETGHAAGHA
jgi:hypothetical protein